MSAINEIDVVLMQMQAENRYNARPIVTYPALAIKSRKTMRWLRGRASLIVKRALEQGLSVELPGIPDILSHACAGKAYLK